MFDKNRFRAQLVLRNVTHKRLAEVLGIDESTLYRKINNNGAFTRDEINQMIEYLMIDDPASIFFATELAETQV